MKLQFGHGSEAVETGTIVYWDDTNNVGFNSATAVKPWKPA